MTMKKKSRPYAPKLNQTTEVEMQRIWAEKDLETKRELIKEIMIKNFTYKKKAPIFEKKIEGAKSCVELDQLAANIYLYGRGMGVNDA